MDAKVLCSCPCIAEAIVVDAYHTTVIGTLFIKLPLAKLWAWLAEAKRGGKHLWWEFSIQRTHIQVWTQEQMSEVVIVTMRVPRSNREQISPSGSHSSCTFSWHRHNSHGSTRSLLMAGFPGPRPLPSKNTHWHTWLARGLLTPTSRSAKLLWNWPARLTCWLLGRDAKIGLSDLYQSWIAGF